MGTEGRQALQQAQQPPSKNSSCSQEHPCSPLSSSCRAVGGRAAQGTLQEAAGRAAEGYALLQPLPREVCTTQTCGANLLHPLCLGVQQHQQIKGIYRQSKQLVSKVLCTSCNQALPNLAAAHSCPTY